MHQECQPCLEYSACTSLHLTRYTAKLHVHHFDRCLTYNPCNRLECPAPEVDAVKGRGGNAWGRFAHALQTPGGCQGHAHTMCAVFGYIYGTYGCICRALDRPVVLVCFNSQSSWHDTKWSVRQGAKGYSHGPGSKRGSQPTEQLNNNASNHHRDQQSCLVHCQPRPPPPQP